MRLRLVGLLCLLSLFIIVLLYSKVSLLDTELNDSQPVIKQESSTYKTFDRRENVANPNPSFDSEKNKILTVPNFRYVDSSDDFSERNIDLDKRDGISPAKSDTDEPMSSRIKSWPKVSSSLISREEYIKYLGENYANWVAFPKVIEYLLSDLIKSIPTEEDLRITQSVQSILNKLITQHPSSLSIEGFKCNKNMCEVRFQIHEKMADRRLFSAFSKAQDLNNSVNRVVIKNDENTFGMYYIVFSTVPRE